MTSRSQVTMDPELQRKARRKAAAMGISFAEYVRRLVREDVGGPERESDPSLVFDLGDGGGSDVARDKGRMIADAVAERSKRS